MDKDDGGASSGAMHGAGGCRLDEDSLDHTLIKSAKKWQPIIIIIIYIAHIDRVTRI